MEPTKNEGSPGDIQSPERKPNCLQKAGSFLAGSLERFYYNLGVAIGKRPIVTIACALLACFLCAIGLVRFYQVDASEPIWVDPKSTYMLHKSVVDDLFPSQIKLSFFIAEGDNILTRGGLLELMDLHDQVTKLSYKEHTYEDLCLRLGRGDNADCWSSSILELWEFNKTKISLLTTQEILDAVNATNESPVTNSEFNASDFLGGISTDEKTGEIKAAKAAIFTYFMKGTNSTDGEENEDDLAEEDTMKYKVEQWEQEFIDLAQEYSETHVTKVQVFASRSFGDEIGSSIFGDVGKLSAGYVLIILYVALILGRFNCVEMRVYLALGGVIGVGLSIAVSFGLSSAFGIGYGPVQSILPFLLLGLGVDDAFVIVQAWNRLTPAERSLPLIEQSGSALKHAGVSITVTSITDIMAFGIGATTVLPALRDFCIYAAIGIIAVFILQASFFSACVVLDEKRRKSKRNGCCCCYTHSESYEPNRCSQRDLQQTFFEKFYAPFLIKLPVKIVIVVISLGILAPGIYGVVYLKQEYDPNVFIPKGSYLKDYFTSFEENFPSKSNDDGYIYLNGVNYYKEHDKVNDMVKDFASEPSVKTSSVDSWLENYLEWLSNTKCPWIKSHIDTSADPRLPLDERRFNMLLTPFVYMTAVGRRHIRNVNFNETITFGDGNGTDGDFNLTNVISSSGNLSNPNLTTPDILDMERDFAARYLTSTRIPFEFVNLESSTVSVEAMDDTRKVVGNYFTDDEVFPFSRSFENWETDKIIQMELYRNMALAFGCVVVLTLFLIADIGTCLLVSFCVLSTLVEVAGLMYFWNLSIDTVTCIQLVLAIGLAVDYSAHIGHTFMTVTGTRNERAMKTLADIGPAVFNGGFSTLLAFMLLASSDSYVFDVFFKVNLLVVLLGMWNGMVLLPVLLSLIGPAPYLSTLNTRRTSSITKISNLAADNDTFQPDDTMEKPVPDANETNKESLHDAENGMMPPQYDTVADRSDKPLTDSSPNQDNDLPAVV